MKLGARKVPIIFELLFTWLKQPHWDHMQRKKLETETVLNKFDYSLGGYLCVNHGNLRGHPPQGHPPKK